MADPTTRNRSRAVPLHSLSGHTVAESVELLLPLIHIDVRDCHGRTPLHCAAVVGNVDVAQLLLQARADPNAVADDALTPLHLATRTNHLATMALLLDAKADADRFTATHGHSSVHLATLCALQHAGDTRALQLLAKYNADFSAIDYNGHTAMRLATSLPQPLPHVSSIMSLLRHCGCPAD
jgi:ankyrin repeat protein